jgi:hypothetical protein
MFLVPILMYAGITEATAILVARTAEVGIIASSFID